MRTLPLIAVVGLVLLAGCSGMFGGEETTQNPQPDGSNPVTPPTTAATTSNNTLDVANATPPTNVSYPAGTSRSGITNISKLFNGHIDTLTEAGSYQSVATETIVRYQGPNDNGSVIYRDVIRVKENFSQPRYQLLLPEKGVQVFGNETSDYVRIQRGRQVRFDKSQSQTLPIESRTTVSTIGKSALLEAGNYKPVDTYTGNGSEQQYIVFRADEIVNRSAIPSSNNFLTRAHAIRGTVVLGEDGVLYSANVMVETTTPEEEVLRIIVETNAGQLGQTSITQPPWLQRAIQAPEQPQRPDQPQETTPETNSTSG